MATSIFAMTNLGALELYKCWSKNGLMLLTNREIRKVTLSLALLSPPNPSFSGICKVRNFY
jgi:hypothetical protein